MARRRGIVYIAALPMKKPALLALAALDLVLTHFGFRWAVDTGGDGIGANTATVSVLCASIVVLICIGIAALSRKQKRTQWPRAVWQTADGETFQTPDLANWHQQRIDRAHSSEISPISK